MLEEKASILADLRRQLLPLQGYKPIKGVECGCIDLGPINHAFPEDTFPLGAVHEFLYKEEEGFSATAGFISIILGSLSKQAGIIVCVSMERLFFPPAFMMFGVDPGNLIFIEVKKQNELLWVMEEVLKCQGLAAVIGVTEQPGLTVSRRWQLAVERSRVTAFILSHEKKNNLTNSCIARWQINALPGISEEDMSGIGYPQWQVRLLKVRNGKPGMWNMHWRNGQLIPVIEEEIKEEVWKRNTG